MSRSNLLLSGTKPQYSDRCHTMRTYFLDIPWGHRVVDVPGVTYDKRLKKTIYTGESLPPELKVYQTADFSWDRWQEDNYNKTILAPEPLPYTMTPRPHQKTAAQKIAKAAKIGYRGFIEGDTTGLGKTISSAFGVYGSMKTCGVGKANVLVVCPKSVIEHWSNTFKALRIPNIRLCIINYEQSKKLLSVPTSAKTAKRQTTRNAHTAKKGTSLVKWDYIISDESQKLKNDSQQTAAFRNIASYAATTDWPFVIWSSATIGQDPMELEYLSPVLYQITKTPSRTSWKDWLIDQGFHVNVAPKSGNVSWVAPKKDSTPQEIALIKRQRAEDLNKLNSLLFSANSPSIRRTSKDIAGWPEIARFALGSKLTFEEKLEYKKEWLSFRTGYKLSLKGKNPKGALAQQLRFRQKSSLIRTASTVEHVESFLENGMQVAVSVEFMESIDKMRDILTKKGIRCVEYTGRNETTRESDRLQFQRGQADVIFISVVQGVSLHSGELLPDGKKATMTPRVMVCHDIRYSSLSMLQIEGRTHRDGEKANVYYSYAYNTVEEKIAKTMIDRMKGVLTIMDDEVVAAELDKILAA
jgi:hypothetical protein